MKKMIFYLMFMLITSFSYAETLIGKVVGVSDGDTITILDSEKKQTKIRLNEIDTPEAGQPYGNKAKQELSDLIYGKTVNIIAAKKDRYGRTLGRVYLNELDVNSELIKRGAAWVYRQYSKDKTLLFLESEARSNKLGLWSLSESERVPPWEWRKNKKKDRKKFSENSISSKTVKNTDKSNANLVCGAKTKCGQMLNCSEAMFYLKSCGLHNLDGDSDGVPCESICR
ncbi:MAG: thermonuclease family protein [Methylophilaceae bacterium]|nr:thermonuclease family protein [Methylophilaceae bacterium]